MPSFSTQLCSLAGVGAAGELAEGRLVEGEGRVAADAEKGGLRLFGGGLPREGVAEEDVIVVLGVRATWMVDEDHPSHTNSFRLSLSHTQPRGFRR